MRATLAREQERPRLTLGADPHNVAGLAKRASRAINSADTHARHRRIHRARYRTFQTFYVAVSLLFMRCCPVYVLQTSSLSGIGR